MQRPVLSNRLQYGAGIVELKVLSSYQRSLLFQYVGVSINQALYDNEFNGWRTSSELNKLWPWIF